MSSTARAAFFCAWLVALRALPAAAYTVHPAVTVRAANIDFYAGHLVLDASGGAFLDDGVAHVFADRILVDLSKNRYVAAGHVVVYAANAAAANATGAALGVDLSTHQGTLVALDPVPASFDVSGANVAPAPALAPANRPSEPLSLVDLEGETPFARASVAVAHLGADVRLGSSRVIVPGGKDVFIPSYVYTFSSNAGYSQSNVSGSSEDIPIFFGSTRDSVSGAHFTYNAVTKVGVGIDHRIVDGDKAYDLFSVSPLNGPTKSANFTWQEQVNGHASQTLNARSVSLSGSSWNYNLSDSVHRSYFNLFAASGLFFNSEALAWQGAYEPLGSGWLGNLFNFHLVTQYGRSQTYSSGVAPVYTTSFESIVQAPSLLLNPSSSLSLQADWRQSFDNQPHRQFAATYGATLQHQWNRFVTTSLTDRETPIVDYYPSFDAGTRIYISQQEGTLSYVNSEPFALRLDLQHSALASVPFGFSIQPWSASLDVRFRVSSSLAFDIARSYGFGYNGQRFGSIGFQIFP